MEVGNNNTISFLDVRLILDNNKIIFDQYHKPSFSARFLNFHSHHPICHKRGIVFGIVDKIFLFSHLRYQKNLVKAFVR